MYYLLEDNRIIEWNGDCIIKDIPKNINGVYKMKKCIIFKSETIKDGFVKKQSENVFELIEVGDLVLSDPEHKEKYSVSGIVQIKEIRNNNGHVSFDTNADSFDVDYDIYGVEWYYIYAIYKPNEKGDYIKVWEKKDE